jgi:hypothetical protein
MLVRTVLGCRPESARSSAPYLRFTPCAGIFPDNFDAARSALGFRKGSRGKLAVTLSYMHVRRFAAGGLLSVDQYGRRRVASSVR